MAKLIIPLMNMFQELYGEDCLGVEVHEARVLVRKRGGDQYLELTVSGRLIPETDNELTTIIHHATRYVEFVPKKTNNVGEFVPHSDRIRDDDSKGG